MQIIDFVYDEINPTRLDVFVSEKAEVSRSRAAQLIEAQNVLINGKTALKNAKLKLNDVIEITLPD